MLGEGVLCCIATALRGVGHQCCREMMRSDKFVNSTTISYIIKPWVTWITHYARYLLRGSSSRGQGSNPDVYVTGRDEFRASQRLETSQNHESVLDVGSAPAKNMTQNQPQVNDRTRGFLSGWRPRGACSWRGTTRPYFHLDDHHHLGTTAQNQSYWFRGLLRVRSRTVGCWRSVGHSTQRYRFFLLPLLLLRQGATDGAVRKLLIWRT